MSKHSQAALETLPFRCRCKFQDRMQSKNSSLQHVPSMGHIPEHDSTLAAAQQPAQELGVNGVEVQRLAETKPAVESQAAPKPKGSGGGWSMVRPGLKRTTSDASKQPDPEMGMKPEGSSAPAESTPLRRSLSNNGGWGALRRHSSSMDANEDSGGQPLVLAHLLKYRLAMLSLWMLGHSSRQPSPSKGFAVARKSQDQGKVRADVEAPCCMLGNHNICPNVLQSSLRVHGDDSEWLLHSSKMIGVVRQKWLPGASLHIVLLVERIWCKTVFRCSHTLSVVEAGLHFFRPLLGGLVTHVSAKPSCWLEHVSATQQWVTHTLFQVAMTTLDADPCTHALPCSKWLDPQQPLFHGQGSHGHPGQGGVRQEGHGVSEEPEAGKGVLQ